MTLWDALTAPFMVGAFGLLVAGGGFALLTAGFIEEDWRTWGRFACSLGGVGLMYFGLSMTVWASHAPSFYSWVHS